MKTKLICLIFLLTGMGNLMAQNSGAIKGVIYDQITGTPVPGANVYVVIGGQPTGATSDVNGTYTLKPLPPGTYTLNVSYMGYQDVKVTGVQVVPNEITFMANIQLAEKGITLNDAVVIDYKRKLIDPGNAGKMAILSTELENIPQSRDISNVLRVISSDIKVDEQTKDILVRGSRPGTSGIFVDGMKQGDTETGVPGFAISSIVVYSGGIPAKYGDVTGGIIVIETKSYFEISAERQAMEEEMKRNKVQ